MGGVPPVHFEVELSVPGVAGEAGFLGGHGAGALDGGEVLREDDAALEFFGARVLATGELDGSAGGPEAGPVALGVQEDLGGGGELGGVVFGGEAGDEGEGAGFDAGAQNTDVGGSRMAVSRFSSRISQ